MYHSHYETLRRRVGWGLSGLAGVAMAWWLTPGVPVLWAPRASAEVKAVGLTLFKHDWAPHDPLAKGGGDGLGPVFNARSCAACHFQGGVGGGGDNDHNVLGFEAFPTQDRPEIKGGLVHKFAVENKYLEGKTDLHAFFPVVPKGLLIEGVCQVLVEDFDPVHTQAVNSTALFGAGWVDRISTKTIRYENMKVSAGAIGRELSGEFFAGVVPGRTRVLEDGRIGKFGWKAQFATLEEFVAAACANEIGLGNPRMEQAKPWTKLNYPKVGPDLDATQFRSLLAFVDTLPRPVEVAPGDPGKAGEAARGKDVFTKVGCAACHTPDVGGVAGVYSDFLLHRLDDQFKTGKGYRERPPVPLPREYPLPEEWKTPPLWGVADSAPYFHDGGSPTLEQAVARHHGDAAAVLAAYDQLGSADRDALIAFLQTLKAPADAEPAPPPAPKGSKGRLALR